jgi:hypothetical protein
MNWSKNNKILRKNWRVPLKTGIMPKRTAALEWVFSSSLSVGTRSNAKVAKRSKKLTNL